ncbi:MAG: molybdopterin converting factor subunit 1 [Burkholderiales bacterium]|nr:molybdopterin converting factor subunit 1 [Anaerolineae bacterium]
MKVTVLLFATLKDLAGQRQISLSLPNAGTATVEDVRRTLAALHPHLTENLNAAITAVNQEYAFAGDAVHDGDEVAFFPPVSGGAGSVDDTDKPEILRLASEALDLDELMASITITATGAVCIFSGMVRGETLAGEMRTGDLVQTQYLEYEAYEPMAIAKMQQVADEIRQQWPLVQGIAIVQRVGVLQVGQNTILIACSSGHRDQGCFEAARYGIDRLKEIVPVWKKEFGRDGSSWVEGHYLPTTDDRAGSTEA